MCGEELILNLYLYHTKKINLKLIIDLNIKAKTITHLEENIKSLQPWGANNFLNRIPKA